MTTELSPPRGHGVVRVAHNLRQHVRHPRDWGSMAGTDYWASFGDVAGIAGNAIGDLDLYGWETVAYLYTAGTGADHLSSTDVGTPGGADFDTAGDYLLSPFIFGDYAHALLAGQFLGYVPTKLFMECYAFFTANNNEEATGFGFVEAGGGGNVLVKGDLMAFVTSDGTDFSLESGAAAAAGSTDNTDPHQFKIEMAVGTDIKWYIDGTEQANTLALQTDLAPYAWSASTAAASANDPVVSWVHIWYE